MNVTAISQYMTRSHGQGKINLELFAELQSRGHTLRLFSTWLERDVAQREGVTWERIPVSPRIPTNFLRCEAFRYQAERRLRESGEVSINNGAAAVVPSVLNVVMFVHSAWLESPWRRQKPPTAHSSFLGLVTRHHSHLEKRALGMARKIVALSNQVRNELIAFCDIDESRIEVIVPGVDSELFSPLEAGQVNPLRSACGMANKDDRVLALFVGEIRSRRKNLDLVLSTIAQHPEYTLAVIGRTTGSPYPAMAEKLGIGDRVFFLGHRNDVPVLMPGADVFVFPTHYEPFGLVVTEAMACGVPVVVTRHAGAACAVEHGRTGWLLKDGMDQDGLTEALQEVLQPERRLQVGRAARKEAERLTWKNMATRYEALLGEYG